jgi:hypothetical protein
LLHKLIFESLHKTLAFLVELEAEGQKGNLTLLTRSKKMATGNYSVGDLTNIPYSNSTYLNDYWTDDVYTFSIDETSSINLNLHNITAGDDADLYLYEDTNGNGIFDTGIDQQAESSTLGSNSDDSVIVRVV